MDQDLLNELAKFDLSKTQLLNTEIEQIQLMGYDFLNAHKMGDIDRCIRIFHIFKELAKSKEGLPDLNEFFGGKKIGFFKHSITVQGAMQYVLNIVDKVRVMNDFRMKPEPMK